MAVASFFTLKKWQFASNNFVSLLDKLSAEDRRIFNFDVRKIDWPSYLSDYCLGIRRYIFKEKDDTIPAARISLIKFYMLQKMTHGLFLFLSAYAVFQLLF